MKERKYKDILIVEDEVLTSEMLAESLRMLGYGNIKIAASGEDAIIQVQEKKPDIIFMDIQLSGDLDGIETAKRIQSVVDIPIVIITGYSMEDVRNKIKGLKINTLLTKPLKIEKMTAILDNLSDNDSE